MIHNADVFKIGKLIKSHGLKGEIVFEFDNDVFDRIECPYLVCLIDGILVPFFIREYRFKNPSTALIIFEDIVNEQQTKSLIGANVYFPRKYYDNDANEELDYSLDFFIGFEVIDTHKGNIGTIVSVDDATINILFLLKDKNEDDLIIPANEDFINDIDSENKKIYVTLPYGLLD